MPCGTVCAVNILKPVRHGVEGHGTHVAKAVVDLPRVDALGHIRLADSGGVEAAATLLHGLRGVEVAGEAALRMQRQGEEDEEKEYAVSHQVRKG